MNTGLTISIRANAWLLLKNITWENFNNRLLTASIARKERKQPKSPASPHFSRILACIDIWHASLLLREMKLRNLISWLSMEKWCKRCLNKKPTNNNADRANQKNAEKPRAAQQLLTNDHRKWHSNNNDDDDNARYYHNSSTESRSVSQVCVKTVRIGLIGF